MPYCPECSASPLFGDLGNGVGWLVHPSERARFVETLMNPAIMPGHRGQVIHGSWFGLCGNPRELLLGPGGERLTTLLAVLDSAPEVPFGRETAELTRRSLRHPWTIDRGLHPTPIGAFAQWSPYMVAMRLRLCTTAWY